MPPFCRSGSNKALLAQIWESRITIVSEQGASYDSSEEHTFSYTRVAKLRFQLREKKKDMLLK